MKPTETIVVEQTTTDTAIIGEYGPVSVVVFEWGGSTPNPESRITCKLVSTKAIKARMKKSQTKVAWLSKQPILVVLSEANNNRLHTEGIGFFLQRDYTTGEYPFADMGDVGKLTDLLNGMTEDEIRTNTYEWVGASHSIYALDAPPDAHPVNVPVRFEVSNRLADISEAQPHLEAHPDVLAVEYDEGRPMSFDHVPARLYVTAKFSDQTHDQLCEYAKAKYASYRKAGERPAGPGGHVVEEALVWGERRDHNRFGDPLGLAQFIRTEHNEYHDPEDDRCWC